MNIFNAAKALGGDVAGKNNVSCPGPGHQSKADRSLSVTFDANAPLGFVVNSFANDDWQTCRDHVRQALGLGMFEPCQRKPGSNTSGPEVIAPDPKSVKKREFAARAWNEARPIGGTLVETYLRNRGIVIPHEIYSGDAIRFHAACPFKSESGEYFRLPAMVAAIHEARGNEFLALHRTILKEDGSGKAKVRGLPEDGRSVLGSSKGGVVKLSSDDDVTMGLGIGEGLETCLAIMGNLGFRPMWSALSTSSMAKFPVLSGIEFLTVWADADASKTTLAGKVITPGIDAARECGARYADAGVQGEILSPPMLSPVGSDWNDVCEKGWPR